MNILVIVVNIGENVNMTLYRFVREAVKNVLADFVR